jgi:hypothetical protein
VVRSSPPPQLDVACLWGGVTPRLADYYQKRVIGGPGAFLLHVGAEPRVRESAMHLRQISESGSYARFFFGLITMHLIVSVFAFCLIAVAYAEERPLHTPSAISVSKNLEKFRGRAAPNL